MKPLPSFSSPSSCNVHQNLSCKNGRTTAGCISRILRRILCFSNLPLCSLDHFNENDKVIIGASGNTPGLVARLMGLESLPRIEPIEESPSMSSADSFKKSRSSPQVRRRRTIPAYQELEDENFFILSFERKKSGKNCVRMEQSVGDKCKKQSIRRTECLQGKNKENEEANMVSKGNLEFGIRDDFQVENPGNVLLPVKNSSKKSVKTRTKKANGENKMAAAISFETEGDSENSSPNSVLEFVGFSTDQESASSGEISRLANSKMRRPLSDELENCGNSREKKVINNGDGEKEKISSRVRNIHQNYAEKWDEIGELAAMETMKSSWLHDEMSNNQNCFIEIGKEVEANILDLMLDELLISLSVK